MHFTDFMIGKFARYGLSDLSHSRRANRGLRSESLGVVVMVIKEREACHGESYAA